MILGSNQFSCKTCGFKSSSRNERNQIESRESHAVQVTSQEVIGSSLGEEMFVSISGE